MSAADLFLAVNRFFQLFKVYIYFNLGSLGVWELTMKAVFNVLKNYGKNA